MSKANVEPFASAAALAGDLSSARVDPNEAAKALAYLRSKRDSNAFFDYLRSINANGRIVIRSGQTLGYYRDLLAACQRHLEGMEVEQMLFTLGWAIRLLRYYRTVPFETREISEQRSAKPAQGPLAVAQLESVRPQRLAAPTLPEVGDILAGKIIDVDESVVIVGVPGFADDKAVGVIKAEAIGDGRTDRYRPGNAARVEVTGIRTLRNGRTVLDLKPAPKAK